MKTLWLSDFPKLLADFDQRLDKLAMKQVGHGELCRLMQEWYGIVPVVDDLGTKASFILEDSVDSTLFLLKWI